MIERLLLNRVDAKARGSTPCGQHHLIALAGPDKTQAPLPVLELAKARADIALNAAIFEMMPVTSGDGVGQGCAISHRRFPNAKLPL